MPLAFVNGAAVPLERAAFDAARLLSRARLPVVSGLDTDAAAIRLAVRIAEKTGGVLDHRASEHSLKLIDVLRGGGGLLAAPEEIKRIADVVLLIGAAKFDGPRVLTLKIDDLPALRAEVGGRKHGSRTKDLGETAKAMGAARYGVVVWRAEDLDAAQTGMAMGLVKDLNAATRCTALPLFAHDAALGADLAFGWLTGFPARTSLARGFAEHDVWQNAAARLVASGEADAALWVSTSPPPWTRRIATVAVGHTGGAARVAFEMGVADESAVYSGLTGSFVKRAGIASAVPALAAILEALP